MKIDRLIGILSVLLQQEKVTAPFLAEKFEVSRRTINRDIEDICKAGIPIVTTRGQTGGISIMDGYQIDRTLLTSSDMQAILTGLKSLDSVSETSKYRCLMDKLSVKHSSALALNNHIMIDLSSWHKSSLAPKIQLIQAAIDQAQKISFLYFSQKGESQRTIEPYLLVFQWSSWYMWGYCTQRHDYRLFKLNRAQNLSNTLEKFEKKPYQALDLSSKAIFPCNFKVCALFQPQVKWRIVDEFGLDSFTEQEDGHLLFEFGFTDKENLFSWLLSFGDQVEFLEPMELRSEFRELTKKIYQKYHQ